MSAGSLCTPCGKATVLPVGTIVTSLQSVSYKHRLTVWFGKENAPAVLELEKDKFLPVLGRRAKKFQDHLKSLTRRPFCVSSEEILELLLRPFADRKPRNSHRPQSHASRPDRHRCSRRTLGANQSGALSTSIRPASFAKSDSP